MGLNCSEEVGVVKVVSDYQHENAIFSSVSECVPVLKNIYITCSGNTLCMSTKQAICLEGLLVIDRSVLILTTVWMFDLLDQL